MVTSTGWGVSYYIGNEGESVRWLQKLEMMTLSLEQCNLLHPQQVGVGHVCAIAVTGAGTCYVSIRIATSIYVTFIDGITWKIFIQSIYLWFILLVCSVSIKM